MQGYMSLKQDVDDRDERLGRCFCCDYEYCDAEVLDGKGVDWGKALCPNCKRGDNRIFTFCQIHPNEAPHKPTQRCEN